MARLLTDLECLTVAREIIVADGGSDDATVKVAQAHGAAVMVAERGRGTQLAAGAAAARAPLLLFLHADVRLDTDATSLIDELPAAPPSGAMAFRLRIDATGFAYRFIVFGAYLRNRLASLPYGDQGLLVGRGDYERAGGYLSIPLMEDVALVRALGTFTQVRLANAFITVSARRWERAVHAASLSDVVARAAVSAPETRILYDDAPGAAAWFAATFPGRGRLPQAGGDLGDRLSNAFAEAFDEGMDSVAIIGADSPTLPRAMLDDALNATDVHDVVLGPALDGGYYLVALRRSAWPGARIMFRDIAWSTEDVLRQTLERVAPSAPDVHLLPPWYDIDRVEDLMVAALHVEPESALRRVLDTLPAALVPAPTPELREPIGPGSRFGL